MGRLISVSGAAGTGKSTLLNELKYKVDSFKVAREVLKHLNTTLYEIVKCPQKTIEFQELILLWKIANDSVIPHDGENVFVERCPADFYAFAKTWQLEFDCPRYDDWLNDYRQQCQIAMKYYDIAIIIPPGKFKHIDDGVRAKANTQVDTHNVLHEFLTRRWLDANFAKPCFHLHQMKTSDIIDRVNEIDQIINDANEYFKSPIEKSYDNKVSNM